MYQSKPQWMILNGQTVGGLTVYHVDEFTTLHTTAGAQRIYHSKRCGLNGQTVVGLTVYYVDEFTTLHTTAGAQQFYHSKPFG